MIWKFRVITGKCPVEGQPVASNRELIIVRKLSEQATIPVPVW